MAILFNFSPTSNHLHPLQVENCDSNSRQVVDEDANGKFRLERVLKDNGRHSAAGMSQSSLLSIHEIWCHNQVFLIARSNTVFQSNGAISPCLE